MKKVMAGLLCCMFGGLLWSWQQRYFGKQILPASYDEALCTLASAVLFIAGAMLMHKEKDT